MQPVVLCHGFTRFDFVTNSRYWKEDIWPAFLSKKGHAVHETKVGWASSLAARGASLLDQLRSIHDQEGGKKLNLIGHSMGGLDIRQAAQLDPEFAQRAFGTVHTIATPHWGSVMADWLDAQEVDTSLHRLGDIIGTSFRGLDDLTFAVRVEQNAEWLPVEEVLYREIPFYCSAGVQAADDVFWPLIWPYRLIKNAPDWVVLPGGSGTRTEYLAAGPNDGLVSVKSGLWYGFDHALRMGPGSVEVWNFDHLNFLGYWDPAEWDLWKGIDDAAPSRSIKKFVADHKRFMGALSKALI